MRPSAASKAGQCYSGPGSEKIPNLGEMQVEHVLENGCLAKVAVQAAPVRKPLLAVSSVSDQGNMAIFDKVLEGCIVPSNAPELLEIRRLALQVKNRIQLHRKGGVYQMKTWKLPDSAAPKKKGFPRRDP